MEVLNTGAGIGYAGLWGMFIETIKSPGLAQLSYLIGDEDAGECIVIDPRRDVEIYFKKSRARGCRIIAALETHIHADFVSGARELQASADIPFYGGESDQYKYSIKHLRDGDTLSVGELTFTAIETPGHSPEHLSYLVAGGEGAEEPWGLFTGDTLFAGSIGRPDLAANMDEKELAALMYNSLFEKMLPMGKGIIVYPGHGSGSPCGGSIGDRDQTTLGYEARHNPKLQASDKEDFIKKALSGLPDEPSYYKRLKKLNATGAKLTEGIPVLPMLTAEGFKDQIGSQNACLLDVREVDAFCAGHIKGAINIALRTSFPPWAGRVVPADKPVYLIGGSDEEVHEAQTHLYRMGFDNLNGYLSGGIRKWITSGYPIAHLGTIGVHALKEKMDSNDALQILDVRSEAEWNSGHIPGAVHCFVAQLPEKMDLVDKNKETVVYCGSDFRANLAASLLAREGYTQLSTLLGSMKAWKKAGYSLEE